MDMLKDAASWLANQRDQYAAEEVTITRGNSLQATVRATRGRTVFEVETAQGFLQRIESHDWIVKADGYHFGHGLTEPERGDRIIADGATYEVSAPTDQDVFRYTDSYRQSVRIHSVRVA